LKKKLNCVSKIEVSPFWVEFETDEEKDETNAIMQRGLHFITTVPSSQSSAASPTEQPSPPLRILAPVVMAAPISITMLKREKYQEQQ
jgi:hypothetical protein